MPSAVVTPVRAIARYHLDTVAMLLVIQPCPCVGVRSLVWYFIIIADGQNAMAVA